MPENTISKIKLPGSDTVYNIKDSALTSRVSNLETTISSSLLFKGTVSSAAGITGLTNYKTGWCYKATAAFTITNVGTVENGDMIICIADYNTAYNANDWTVVQNNVDVFSGATSNASGIRGLVPAPASGDTEKILRSDGTWTDQYIKNIEYPNQPITKAAYDQLSTEQKNADIVYQITDDTVGGQLATKAELTAGLATKANSSDVSAKANKASAFTVTLDDSSWSNQAQTVSNVNFEADGYSYIVSPVSASFQDYLEAQIYADDVTTDGSMTFHCDTEPVVDITVNVFKAEVV